MASREGDRITKLDKKGRATKTGERGPKLAGILKPAPRIKAKKRPKRSRKRGAGRKKYKARNATRKILSKTEAPAAWGRTLATERWTSTWTLREKEQGEERRWTLKEKLSDKRVHDGEPCLGRNQTVRKREVKKLETEGD